MINNSPIPEALLWTARQTAAALQISERTLFSWTRDGLVPAVRIGRTVRYCPAAVMARLNEIANEGPGE